MYPPFVFDPSVARIVAYLDSVQARLAPLRELQSQTQEELDALLPSAEGATIGRGVQERVVVMLSRDIEVIPVIISGNS